MKLVEERILFNDHYFTLTNQRAMYWETERALILSDLHLGKAAHFRKHGISLPTTVSLQDLLRLHELLDYYSPKQVIIVGDLIHAATNSEVDSLAEVTSKYDATEFILIEGNHDRHASSFLQRLGISRRHEELSIQGIRFVHQPTHDEIPTISGHIHPGVRVRLPHKKYLRFPCYAHSGQQLVLPAFSLFTGLDSTPLPHETVYYAIHDDGIFIIRNTVDK